MSLVLRAVYEDPTLEPPAVLWVPTNIYDGTADLVNIVSNASVPRVVYGGFSTPHRSLLKPLLDPNVRQVSALIAFGDGDGDGDGDGGGSRVHPSFVS